MEMVLTKEEVLRIEKMLQKQKIEGLGIIIGYAILLSLLSLYKDLNKTFYFSLILTTIFGIGMSIFKVIKASNDLKKGNKIIQEMEIKYVEWFMVHTYYMEPKFRILYPQIRQFKISKNKLKEGVKVELSYLPESKQIIGFRILE